MPKTGSGKLSLRLLVIFFALLAFQTLLVQYFNKKRIALGENPLFAVGMIAGIISAIASFFTGILGIVKQNERGVLVLASTLIGFLILIFVIGELVVPH